MNKRSDMKVHYKMFKSGKAWVFASITAGILAVSFGNVTAQANEQNISKATTEVEVTQTVAAEQADAAESETAVTGNEATPEVPATTMTVESTASSEPGDAAMSEAQPAVAAPATSTAVPASSVADQQPDTVAPAATTRPAQAMTVVESAAPASATPEPTTRPANVTASSVANHSGADHTIAAVPLVQAELAKPATIQLAHSKDTATIDLWMPNKTLQQVILLTLQGLNGVDKTWDSVADITQKDLALLKSLNIRGFKGYSTYIDGKTEFSIEGLEYAVNLESIDMGNDFNASPGAYFGDLVDIKPLANLQHLTTVALQGNRIKDVTPLANLQNVTSLTIYYNHIRDFSSLKGKHYDEFKNFSQFILLDQVMIDQATQTGHLQIQCLNADGSVAPLAVYGSVVGEPVFNDPEADEPLYHFYYVGGNAVADGNGGLNYSYIQPQKPGVTESPAPGFGVAPLADYYYLTGVNRPAGSSIPNFVVIQPYAMSHTGANVVVHHQDTAGNQLAPDETLTAGLVGENYNTAAVTIPGYTLTATPDNATGQFGETTIDVTYVYAQDNGGTQVKPPVVTPPATQTTVTVHHQTATGQTVAADQVYAGKPGMAYTTQAAQPTGYVLLTTPANAQGTFGDTNITVTYIYAPLQTDGGGDQVNPGETPGTPNPDGGQQPQPGDQGNPAGPSTGTTGDTGDHVPGADNVAIGGGSAGVTSETTGSVQLAHQHSSTAMTGSAATTLPDHQATTLPQTGNRQSPAIWGVALLISVLGLFGLKRRVK
ncbi:MucBP domain-containing protein [Levilactobacillus tongjiangensis]|uniref:MucBP domain-containing protein n=1 Tax=Levilactobacillus tongjiangensis TaxID=2486023 RepID=A0ABW1SPP9_9LACO|nr:MucBP domain-containing protein [Levilactobacillus tongjiangensis]